MLISLQRPPPPQKYYLVVNLVKITSVDELVQALQNRVEPKEAAIDKSTFWTDCRRQGGLTSVG